MLQEVVTQFRPLGGAGLGYEGINEPYPGQTWAECFQLEPNSTCFPFTYTNISLSLCGCPQFDQTLAEFYNHVIPFIRRADKDTVVFYEPNLLFDFRAPSFLPRLNFSNVALAVHTYAANVTAQAIDAQQFGASFNIPVIVTEFGATHNTSVIEAAYTGFNQAMLSAAFWTYYNDATFKFTIASMGPANQSIIVNLQQPLTGSNVNLPVLNTLSQPYPAVVSGTPISFSFDIETSSFVLEYLPTFQGVSTVVVPPVQQFQAGYAVTLSSGLNLLSNSTSSKVVVLATSTSSSRITITPTANLIQCIGRPCDRTSQTSCCAGTRCARHALLSSCASILPVASERYLCIKI